MSEWILRKIFERIAPRDSAYSACIVFAGGREYRNHPDTPPQVTARVKTHGAQWRTILLFPIGFFDAYIDETLDLEGDNPIHILAVLAHEAGFDKGDGKILSKLFSVSPLVPIMQLWQEFRQDNTGRQQAIKNAEFHYALPVELFQHKLGETVGYSEGYWLDGVENINQAKHNLYEYVCQKLQLEPGMTVIEVGSGWGFLPIYAVKNYGVNYVIYNPVEAQNTYMRERFKRHGVDDRIRLEFGAHRDIVKEGQIADRFVSIGVHEHHGIRKNMYNLWWENIATVLKDDGIGLVSFSSFMKYGPTSYLTLRYIWPGGHIPSVPMELSYMYKNGLSLIDVENSWPHYYKTLMTWRDRFKKHWPEIQASNPDVFTERFRRRWTMYLEGVPETFERGLDCTHITFIKGRNPDAFPVSLASRHEKADFRTGGAEVERYE